MSKRRNRKEARPNVPPEVLDRIRQEAGLPPLAEAGSDSLVAPVAVSSSAPVATTPRRTTRRRRNVDPETLSNAEIQELLANPTRTVSEAELREQYSYVIKDLRSMFGLVVALFAFLIIVAQLL